MTDRILVVEDDEPVANVLRRGLALAGYEVTVADDGPSGVSRWAEGGWSAVVLDLMLPGMDGIEVCRDRRADGDTTPVLLLTARDDEDLRRAAIAAGADRVMTKPFAYAELLAVISVWAQARNR
jgi:DNA-binding response OmpR family regulator